MGFGGYLDFEGLKKELLSDMRLKAVAFVILKTPWLVNSGILLKISFSCQKEMEEVANMLA